MPIIGIIASGANVSVPSNFVIAGRFATSYTSTDGITWSVIPNEFYSVAGTVDYSNLFELNNELVASSSVTTIYSTDGTTWTRKNGGIPNYSLDIVWDGSQYVGVTQASGPATSTDGITWEFRNLPASADYGRTFRIAYGSGETQKYVIVSGADAGIWSSTNGITWTTRVSRTTDLLLLDVIYANGIYVAVGSNSISPNVQAGLIRTSTDGVTWTTRTASTGTTSTRRINQAAWNGTYFLAATQSIGVQYSTDGTTWSTGTLPGTAQTCVSVAALTDGTSFLVGDNGTFYTSTNGTTWTSRTNAAITSTATNVAYFDSKWFVATNNATNAFAYSTNFTTWTGVATGILRYMDKDNRNVNKILNTYFFSGAEGVFYSSTDLVSFTRLTLNPDTTNVYEVTYGASTYVVVGDAGNLSTSTNGITWTSRTSGFSTNEINTATYGENKFVIGGGGGRISTSTDGITWTSRTANFGTSTIRQIVYDSSFTEKFIAVGDGGTIRSSTDGITWTTRTSNTTNTLVSVISGGGLYVVGGLTDTIRTSTDAITWTTRTIPFTANLDVHSLAYSATNGYIAMGQLSAGADNFAGYATSTDAITWTSRTTNLIDRSTIIYGISA